MNDTARPLSGVMVYLPTAVAAAALASVFWLLLVSTCQGINARVEYNEEAKTRQYYPPGYTPKTEATPIACALLLVVAGSAFVSLALIITAFCFWPRHLFAGKVLTVASAVLFLPFLCCGVGLGIV